MSSTEQLSALKEQKLLRRAEARIASAARAIKNLEGMGEGLMRDIGAGNDPLMADLRREYDAMVLHMEELAGAAGRLHFTAEEICRKRGAEIIHESGGTPKEPPVISDWILTGGMKRVPQTS